ncbi:hypothetical protein Dda_3221 [Drechslerella dactyloides]|uniref:Origin recognition complex subunit 4 n=1 Tax=Drechslerella dactyloides TaxID=74499 RepID=A0AAD6J117_DREDA|nr:hypothetical protein Dda_3221 [Drechslerella dactyloides]
MSTRHSTRTARPSVKALESSSASPPAVAAATSNTTATATAAAGRPQRSTRSAASTAARDDGGDELPVAKRRKISPESAPRSRKRASGQTHGGKAGDEHSSGDEEDEQDAPRRGRQKSSGRSADSASDAKSKPVAGKLRGGRSTAAAKPIKATAKTKAKAGVTTHQKIQNLYGGRRKHVDRDDTPGSSSVRDASPGTSAKTTAARKKQAHALAAEEEHDAGVDKFRRGRHGSGKKKAAAAKSQTATSQLPTIVVDGVAAATGDDATGKRKGRKAAVEDTDKEGDVIMGEDDDEATGADAPTGAGGRRGRKAASANLAVEAPKKGRGGRKKANGTSNGAVVPAKKDDESSIYDFPGSDEEDVFTPRAKKVGKAPSKLTASLRRAAILRQEDEISSSSRGNEAGDEKEKEKEVIAEVGVSVDVETEVEDTPITAATSTVQKPKQLPKFTGNVTDDAVKLLQQMVMKKMTGRELPDKLVGLTDEYNAVHQLLEQTVVAGEGNSILLVGPHGSGKSLVAEKAVAELQKHHAKDFIVVRLSGCLQTDERTAVREIWRQLGSSMELDESKPINFADTLTTILALLSHPSEHDPAASADSMAETTSISVLFLLSEFEQFAAHPRQTLLYNLFDIAQARKAPIAVVGMTSKVNIVEDLEKRVKSRFSHRTLGFRIGGGLGARLDGWWELAKAGLCVDLDELPGDVGRDELAYYDHWNASLDDAFQHDKAFRRTVEGVYSTSKSVHALYNHFIVSICELSATQPFLGSGQAMRRTALVAPDSKLYLLEELPELSLALLICAARLDPILETDTCNFTMAYDEYKAQVARVKVYNQATWAFKLWGKEVALAAWEKLAEYELIVPVVGTAAGGGAVGVTASALVGSGSTGVGRRESRMFRVDVGLLEIKRQARAWGLNGTLLNWKLANILQAPRDSKVKTLWVASKVETNAAASVPTAGLESRDEYVLFTYTHTYKESMTT